MFRDLTKIVFCANLSVNLKYRTYSLHVQHGKHHLFLQNMLNIQLTHEMKMLSKCPLSLVYVLLLCFVLNICKHICEIFGKNSK